MLLLTIRKLIFFGGDAAFHFRIHQLPFHFRINQFPFQFTQPSPAAQQPSSPAAQQPSPAQPSPTQPNSAQPQPPPAPIQPTHSRAPSAGLGAGLAWAGMGWVLGWGLGRKVLAKVLGIFFWRLGGGGWAGGGTGRGWGGWGLSRAGLCWVGLSSEGWAGWWGRPQLLHPAQHQAPDSKCGSKKKLPKTFDQNFRPKLSVKTLAPKPLTISTNPKP